LYSGCEWQILAVSAIKLVEKWKKPILLITIEAGGIISMKKNKIHAEVVILYAATLLSLLYTAYNMFSAYAYAQYAYAMQGTTATISQLLSYTFLSSNTAIPFFITVLLYGVAEILSKMNRLHPEAFGHKKHAKKAKDAKKDAPAAPTQEANPTDESAVKEELPVVNADEILEDTPQEIEELSEELPIEDGQIVEEEKIKEEN
jgi:hypothetical protein